MNSIRIYKKKKFCHCLNKTIQMIFVNTNINILAFKNNTKGCFQSLFYLKNFLFKNIN